MKKDINLKKTGLTTVKISSIILSIAEVFVAIIITFYHGNNFYWPVSAIHIFILGIAYYFCTKSFDKHGIFSFRQAIRGPLLGLTYCIYLLMNGVGLAEVSLAIGYILVLIYNIGEVKQARIMTKQ